MIDFDLTTVWAFIIAFAVFAYVVLDGFDLGIGILFPAITVGHGRNRAMNAIAPVWDGNETWLVMGGGGLLAAFPLAYAVILPATYPLIIAMLLGLVFRGVAFEFRWRDERHRAFWDFAFFGGSLVAALSQGMVLGAILQGIEVTGRSYSGSWWDWLTPYTLLTGLGVVAGYALLGACWLVWKLEGEVQEPSSVYPATTPRPVSRVYGVSQSHQLPAYWRPSMSMPCSTAPRIIPCDSAAISDPPKNDRSQNARCPESRQRNSNATPRKISPSSIAMTSG